MLMQCIAAALVALILMANNSMFIDAACSDMAGYNRCISKYARQVSDCGSLVKSTPTFAYYSCMCEGDKMSLSCYAHCPEDRELMGQREARLNSPACEWVKDQQANGGDKTTATSTATINASKTGSAIANASKTSTIGKSTATKTATGKETPTSTAYKGQPPREGDLQDLSGAAEAVYSGATLIARGTALAVIAMIV